jgi:putative endonuclease
MSSPSSATLGRLGEDVAALLLASRGYAVVGRNVRFGRREIDLVVERGRLLVAVEVKWRREGDRAMIEGAWSRAQRGRAHEAVLLAMAQFPGAAGRPWRFDLVHITAQPRGWVVEHRPGAWTPAVTWW